MVSEEFYNHVCKLVGAKPEEEKPIQMRFHVMALISTHCRNQVVEAISEDVRSEAENEGVNLNKYIGQLYSISQKDIEPDINITVYHKSVLIQQKIKAAVGKAIHEIYSAD